MQGSDSKLYVAYVLDEALGETEIQEARLGEPGPGCSWVYHCHFCISENLQ